ncbi:GIN domain-containing protein [Sphingobium rhizovicinum]|uniref:GIN domain-containing protein n=1 Tax=Sphingobium rhizovicinum TaxID=432308 RepID=A0ABV7NFC3_9SPHN
MHDQGCGTGRSALRALSAAGLIAGLMIAAPAGAATRGFTITSFDAIRVEAPVTIILTTGAGASARAEGDQAMLDRLKLDVSGRLLTITADRARNGTKSGGAATLRLSTGALERVMLAGGGSLSINRMKGLRGDIIVGGNGDVSVAAVDLDQIGVTMAGGGRVALNGRAGVATIRLSGPGTIAAEPLRARQATITNDGAGSLTLTTDVTAKIIATGSGNVTIAGKPACSVDNRGVGRVLCGGETY